MPAAPERTGRNKARAFCPVCQDGVNGTSWAKAVLWSETHNLKVHKGEPGVAEADVPAYDPEHAPGAAREIPADVKAPSLAEQKRLLREKLKDS